MRAPMLAVFGDARSAASIAARGDRIRAVATIAGFGDAAGKKLVE